MYDQQKTTFEGRSTMKNAIVPDQLIFRAIAIYVFSSALANRSRLGAQQTKLFVCGVKPRRPISPK